MKISRDLSSSDDTKMYVIAVAIALTLASVLLVTYLVYLRPAPDRYMTLYLFDSNRTTNYPEYLVANVNSTFTVYVDVENHLGQELNNTQVLVKITSNTNPTFPLDTNITQTLGYGPLKDGASAEKTATISLNAPGNYLVAFELWIQKTDTTPMQYSNDLTTLNIKVGAA